MYAGSGPLHIVGTVHTGEGRSTGMYSGANMCVLSECDETYSSDDEEEEGWAMAGCGAACC